MSSLSSYIDMCLYYYNRVNCHICCSLISVSGLDLGNLQEKIPDLTDPRTNDTYVNGLVYSTKYRLYVWPKNTKGRGEVSFIEASTSGPGCKYCCTGAGVMRRSLMTYLFRNNVKSHYL